MNVIILEQNESGSHRYDIDLRVIAALQAQGQLVNVRDFEDESTQFALVPVVSIEPLPRILA